MQTGGWLETQALMFTLAVHMLLPPFPSLTVRDTMQETADPEAVFTVSVGVELAALLKLAPGQFEVQAKVSGSPSGSLEPLPLSGTEVVAPWHGAE